MLSMSLSQGQDFASLHNPPPCLLSFAASPVLLWSSQVLTTSLSSSSTWNNVISINSTFIASLSFKLEKYVIQRALGCLILMLCCSWRKEFVSLGSSFCGLCLASQENSVSTWTIACLLMMFRCTWEENCQLSGSSLWESRKEWGERKKGERSNSPFAFSFYGADAVCSCLLYKWRQEQPQSCAI